ncbi:MAG: hypothetical protein BMS9Abin13_018 [Patescibacteria group bacterium]|nr:MAG: hypothetical protein BMS9Abin13_018 [Patescibacteria group bacterium]
MNSEHLLSAEELINHVDLYRKRPHALILFKHLVRIRFLAGWDVSNIPKEGLHDDTAVSLAGYDIDKLVSDAGERLRGGLIPERWEVLLEESLVCGTMGNVIQFEK